MVWRCTLQHDSLDLNAHDVGQIYRVNLKVLAPHTSWYHLEGLSFMLSLCLVLGRCNAESLLHLLHSRLVDVDVVAVLISLNVLDGGVLVTVLSTDHEVYIVEDVVHDVGAVEGSSKSSLNCIPELYCPEEETICAVDRVFWRVLIDILLAVALAVSTLEPVAEASDHLADEQLLISRLSVYRCRVHHEPGTVAYLPRIAEVVEASFDERILTCVIRLCCSCSVGVSGLVL